MKKICNYTFQLVCIYILVLSCFLVTNFDIKKDNYKNNIYNLNNQKALESTLLVDSNELDQKIEEEKEESINLVENINDSTQKQEIENDNISQNVVPEETITIIDTSSFAVLSQETINLSHYGHDCNGCTSGYTASGYYVGDGRIYYQDPSYGSVRIVAADNKYPLGTIVRIGYHGDIIVAIVLDRGGGIGDGKSFQIDLLTSNDSQANELGIIKNTSMEVLRLGY